MKSSPIMTMQLSFCVAFAAAVVIVCVNRVTGYLPVDAYDNGHVGKKGSPRYADYGLLEVDAPPSSCTREADYEISQNYIIRTKDSKQNGANFVAALSVRTFDVCLEQCCLKENCDTTIFVGEAYRSEETNCFLFVCRPDGKYGDNRCLFTYHLGYISSMKKALGGFEGYASDPITTAIPVQQIETTTKPTPPPKQFPPIAEPDSNCPEGYFECDSGQCINELYICNSVLDCDDGTDEYGCNPQEPPPAEKTNADQDMFTEDQKLPQSHLIPPTNPPNIPNKYSADAEPGPSIKGEADQTLADQLNDQSPSENVAKGTNTMQDPNQSNREKELSDVKLRLQDESRGRLPQVLDNQEADKDEDQDQFPELECHGTTCFEIQPDGGKTRFGGVLDEEQDEEVERERVDEEENLKPRPENQQKNPLDTHQRNLEREEYQTGDLRDDDENYQGPQRAKLLDYKEDAAKFLFDKSTGEYRLDEESNTKYDVIGKGDERDEQRDDEGRGGRYLDDKHLSDVEDRDASEQRVLDYDPIDRKIISDHDVGMKHPADVQSTRNDAYRDGDTDRQDRPPLRDGNKNRGFPNKPLKPRPPTQPPVRQGVSNSEPHLGAGYGYNSDYYSYYYQPYGQTQDRSRSQQAQNSKWQVDRSRQDSYGGRHSQVASNYQSKNKPHRVPETQYDDRSRYGTNTDVYSNIRYHKVSDMTSDHRKNQRPVDDVQTRPRYNSLWNTWPNDYSSSVIPENDLSLKNIDRDRQYEMSSSSKSRNHLKGHKLNGIAADDNALAPPKSNPTSTTTLSSIHLAVVTQAPVPIDENAPQSVEVVTVVAPPNEAVTDGKAKDDGKVNDTNVLTQQDGPNMLEMVPESHGGSGMPPASSAILPLVIGLVITVCLLLMVGCRLRYMNQRLRYGRLKTSAHDADYLINGMYL
ncbi:uncharacterized protein LOC129264810 isoform X1 [Lytechinus pictus]|uniref:uncharacterized protein LOC129264810 isoform X1 n=1 Tax=Lytechinus pictus TaxID=7653 RepID=UPI0030B9CBE3